MTRDEAIKRAEEMVKRSIFVCSAAATLHSSAEKALQDLKDGKAFLDIGTRGTIDIGGDVISLARAEAKLEMALAQDET